ncbi:helix-turn-helix domain-containing protein [Paenibacillus allorhizosphaerae]|uniref:Arabinose operon regulatory protein n=1 Tax=Paenibacillus allorhizosphaerae TaxID=2849866 RepID=A0ABN7TS41_9BACL|nr:helix-turn-helix domain-containing protein [Paenibacillus allorhizosphaerae]CAG7653637.1 Arabinose operon regulatory protein [Paenibacillus allorhizosphaerae]
MAEHHNDPVKETKAPPPGILVAGHFRETYGYATMRSKGTRDWLMTFTIAGQGEYRSDGRSVSCCEGDVILLPPGVPHHYYTPEGHDWDFYWAHFVPEPRWSELLQPAMSGGGLIRLKFEHKTTFERIVTAFERLLKYSLEDGTDYYQRLLSLNAMEEIVVLLAKNTQKRGHLDPRIEETLNYISSHLKEQHTIESLAHRVLLSPSRLSHLFREQTGDSVMDTLIKLRLRHAARLLEHTSLRISEVAEEVGFHSPFYFTKQFTACFGQNPSQFRAATNHAGD